MLEEQEKTPSQFQVITSLKTSEKSLNLLTRSSDNMALFTYISDTVPHSCELK